MSKTPAKTVSPLRTRMIEQMRMGALSSGTQRLYLGAITSLARDTGTAPDQLDAEQVRAWVLGLIDRGLAPASTNATLSALRFFFCEVIDRPEVVHGLRNRKRPRRLPCHMAEHEVERLLLATPDLRSRTAILLTYVAGLRISETVAVQVVDIKADGKLLHIRSGKGDVERLAPLPEPPIKLRSRHHGSVKTPGSSCRDLATSRPSNTFPIDPATPPAASFNQVSHTLRASLTLRFLRLKAFCQSLPNDPFRAFETSHLGACSARPARSIGIMVLQAEFRQVGDGRLGRRFRRPGVLAPLDAVDGRRRLAAALLDGFLAGRPERRPLQARRTLDCTM